jgi:hypothetical protein
MKLLIMWLKFLGGTLLIVLFFYFLVTFKYSIMPASIVSFVDRSSITEIQIEGCDYFEVPQHGIGNTEFFTLTHKGNCRACRAWMSLHSK